MINLENARNVDPGQKLAAHPKDPLFTIDL